MEKNNLKFNLISIFYKAKDSYINLTTEKTIRNTFYEVNVSEYDTLDLLFDFKENNYSHLDEIFTINVKLEKLSSISKNESSSSSTGIKFL